MRLILFLYLLTIATPSYADALDDFLNAFTQLKQVPGSAVIIKDGEQIRSYYYGDDISENSQFHIGSITKLYTASLIMKLIKSGKIELDDYVHKHVHSDFNGDEIDNYKLITFRHVLESSTGLADHHGTELIKDTFLGNTCLDNENDAARYVYGLPAIHKAGEGIGYSSLGYVILGSVLKNIYNQESLEKIFKEHLLGPYDFEHTSFYPSEDLVNGVERYSSAFPLTSTELWEGCMRLADGGLVASAKDVLSFLGLNLDMQSAPDSLNTKFGEAWGHKGRFPGYVSAAYNFPDSNISIVILINSGLVQIEPLLGDIIHYVFTGAALDTNMNKYLRLSYEEEVADQESVPLPDIGAPPPL